MAEFPKQPEHEKERTVSLHGGTISRNSPTVLEPSQAASIENMIFTGLGVREQRRGCLAFGGIENDPPGGIDGYTDASFDAFLISIWGSLVYDSTGNGAWSQIASNTSMVSGLLHQYQRGRSAGDLAITACTCEQPTDTTVGLNGRSQLIHYNIASDVSTQVSIAPRCITAFQGRLFYAEFETLGWSEVGDFADYSDTNSILVEAGIGGNITALVASRDANPKLWILKENAILLFQPRWGDVSGILPDPGITGTLEGDELNLLTSDLKVLTDETGCIATKTARWVPGLDGADVLFLSDDGIRSLERADNDAQRGAGFPISYQISAWINRINFSRAHTAVAAVFDNAYHIAVPMDGALEPNFILRYDIRQKAWTLLDIHARDIVNRIIVDTRLFIQNGFASVDTSVTEAVDAASPVFQVYQMYRGDVDPSTNLTDTGIKLPHFREESRGFVFGEPLIEKRWEKFVIHVSSAETSRIAIQYRRNQGTWNTVTETVIGGTEDVVILGVDALPWTANDQLKRRFTVGLNDVTPGVEFQMALARVTGSTEPGRLSVYMTELQARLLTDEHANDA